jgi:flavodoxin
MNKLTLFAASLLMLIGTSACAQNSNSKKMNENKTLIAWFSWSGNTEAVVKHMAEKTGADTFRIERTEAYPTDYDECADEAKKEVDDKVYPSIKGLPGNFDQYETIIVAVPVWWYTAPMPVFTFLEKSGLDFSGKTVIPFCTAYTAEYNTLKDIVKATPEAEHKDGICIVTKEMGGKGIDKQYPKVDTWLSKVGL